MTGYTLSKRRRQHGPTSVSSQQKLEQEFEEGFNISISGGVWGRGPGEEREGKWSGERLGKPVFLSVEFVLGVTGCPSVGSSV